ncbi:MAG: diaminopimelate decarboxylase [Clostridia bacterium]
MNTRETLKINKLGHLEIGGCDAVELANAYGTPLYIMDEAYIREVASIYKQTLLDVYGNSEVAFASKAFSCVAMYALLKDLGLSTDIVSGGEAYTALRAGFNLENAFFHGNNKGLDELDLAIKNGIGTIVIESEDELIYINNLAKKYNRVQRIMIRVNPGVEAHTHEFIQTANVDSKFGIQIDNPKLDEIIDKIRNYTNLYFYGLHIHIGSQIFDTEPFILAIDILTNYMKRLSDRGISCEAINLGGGFGVTYTNEDVQCNPELYSNYISTICKKVLMCISDKGLVKPKLILEPGRALVGEAGVTLYTVGSIKNIPNVRKYVSIDGGMFENPRFALYGAKYSATIANRALEKQTEIVTIAGKCCESGDIISKDVSLQPPERGDIMAVFSTGAYNYSMSSNYNGNFVPPVVLVLNGKAEFIVRPQTYDDLIRNQCVPSWLNERNLKDKK